MQKEDTAGYPGSAIKNPKAFLYKITRNMVIDHYRKKGSRDNEGESNPSPKRVSLEEMNIEDRQIRADKKAILDSEIEQIKKSLGNLNEDYQNVIIWYYLDELTIPEIASLLGKPEANIRVLIHRAVTSLKKEMNSPSSHRKRK